jgi:hypothetical protein
MALGVARLGADDFLDQVEDRLSTSAFDDNLRARLSGTLELERYRFTAPAPGLLHADGRDLFAPRLAMFLDSQIGRHAYVFAQMRVDRGFDPDDDAPLRARLDEYALRLTPFLNGRMHFQIGKFATVVGNWVPRHGAWGNPFITAPLPYENLTGVWDAEPVKAGSQLLQWSHIRPGLSAAVTAREKYLRLPVIWGPSYTVGAAAFGTIGKFSYAAEMKNASLSSRPEEWSDGSAARWRHPTFGGRVGWHPDAMWTLGLSASTGSYLRTSAEPLLVRGFGFDDYRQTIFAGDAGFAWHHWQAWAEVFTARFAIPAVGNADTTAYYAEVKYKFTPQFFGAVRWNQQLFADIPDRAGPTAWGRDAWRIDFAPGYRFTPHTQLKLQYSLAHEAGATGGDTSTAAAQFTLRF